MAGVAGLAGVSVDGSAGVAGVAGVARTAGVAEVADAELAPPGRAAGFALSVPIWFAAPRGLMRISA